MVWILVILNFLWWNIFPISSQAEPLVGADLLLPRNRAAVLPPVAGIPYNEASQIVARHQEELMRLPGVQGISLGPEGILIDTEFPTAVPATIEGLPVQARVLQGASQPPAPGQASEEVAPLATQGNSSSLPASSEAAFPPVAGIPHDTALAIVDRHRDTLLKVPKVYSVVLGKEGIRVQVLIYTSERVVRQEDLIQAKKSLPTEIEGLPVQIILRPVLPPPMGAIVLQPDGKREEVEKCPEGFREETEKGWRFCIDLARPQPIPPVMEPPIAGVSYEKALEIVEKWGRELSRIPGVTSVGLGEEGIMIETDQPGLLPAEVEGLTVKAIPSPGPARALRHTSTARQRPLTGAVIGRDPLLPPSSTGQIASGVITGVVLSQGKPWLVFPAHFLKDCGLEAPCRPALTTDSPPLNLCVQHNTGSRTIIQPPDGPIETVGFPQRWDFVDPFESHDSTDVAAAFMDNDSIEGNGSLAAIRSITTVSNFTGMEKMPVVGDDVIAILGRDPHRMSGTIRAVGQRVLVGTHCLRDSFAWYKQQTRIEFGPLFPQEGDSGSPVLTADGTKIVGMSNYGLILLPQFGGGTAAPVIRTTLGFDQWYGTATVPDQTIGTFNTSTTQWRIDNGNGRPNTCSTATTKDNDDCFTYGQAGDIPITGDWDGSGSITVGVFRPSNTTFYLRNSNSAGAPNITLPTGPFDYQPVAGKWGAGANTKVGVFRSSTKEWYLGDGDFVIEGCPPDTCFTTSWTQTGDMPLAGDWDSNGSVTLGVFRPSTGAWYLVSTTLPVNCATDQCVGPFGGSADRLVAFGASIIRAN